MSTRGKWLRILAVVALVACTGSGLPATAEEDRPERLVPRSGDLVSIFGGEIRVPADVRQRGTVVSVGGNVVIEGEVSRDVVVILGSLTLTGDVDGNVTAILSEQKVSNSRIDDVYVNVLGSVEMERTSIGDEFIHVLGPLVQDPYSTRPVFDIGTWFPSLWTFIFWARLLRLLTVFVLLVLLAVLVPDRVRLIADRAPVRYVTAFFAGLLGYLAILVLVSLLSVTVIGLPVAVLGYYVLKWLGIAGIFLAVGRRLGRGFGREMSLLGAILLTFGLFALVTLAPTPLGIFGLLLAILIRTLFFLAVEVPAVGLVILTRIGTYDSSAAEGPEVPVSGPPLPDGPPPG